MAFTLRPTSGSRRRAVHRGRRGVLDERALQKSSQRSTSCGRDRRRKVDTLTVDICSKR